MNGPECRDSIVTKAITVSEPYFDSINIIQNGYLEKHSNPLLEKYTIYTSKSFIGYILAYEMLLTKVDIGDYFLILDSDEIPSVDLLEFIKKREFNEEFNTYGIQYYHHDINNDGELVDVYDSGTSFSPHRFFRKEIGIEAKTWLGAHQAFHQLEPTVAYPALHINHIKHQFAIHLSSFAHGVNSPESVGISTGLEFEILTKIKDTYNAIPSFIYQVFDNKELLKEIRARFDVIDQSPTEIRNMIKGLDFAISTNKSLLELYQYSACTRGCCSYV